jgi:hypothetical protein
LERGEDVIMMRNQWDTLRVGDAVFVHGDDGGLLAATVAFVTEAAAPGEPSAVGFRVIEADETYYAWPEPADVHREALEVSGPCPRCQPSTAATAEAAGAAPVT